MFSIQWSGSSVQPKMRLDFMLVSPTLVRSAVPQSAVATATTTAAGPAVGAQNHHSGNSDSTTSISTSISTRREEGYDDYDKIISAGVEVTDHTEHLSDHFPVYFHWREAYLPHL
jgi:hypothetical protein